MVAMPRNFIIFPLRDNVTNQDISVLVRENLTLSNESQEVTFTEVNYVPLAEYCLKKLNDKLIQGFL